MTAEFVVKSTIESNRTSPFRFIVSNVMRHKLLLLLLIIGAFSNAALAAVVPYFIGQAFDKVNSGEPDEQILGFVLLIAIAILISQLVRAFLQFMRNYSAETFGQRFERDVRDELYSSLLGKSMAYHDLQPVGDVMARVTNDVREMNLMMNPGLNLLIGSGMFMIMPVIASPLIYPSLILVPLFFLIGHLTVQYFFIRQLHPVAQNIRSNFGVMNARLAEAIEGVDVIKSTSQESEEISLFNRLVNIVRDYVIRQGDIEARYLSLLLLGLTFVLALIHSGYLYSQGIIEVGDVVAFIGLIYLFGFPVFTSLFSLSRIASGYASAGRILSVIVAKTDLDRNPKGYAKPIKGDVRFDDVTFGYIKGQDVLHDISFTVPAGKTVALVGQTGSGKTSITKLINRIYDVDQGSVSVDGVDVREWKLASLRSQISIIEQDIFLFSRTIAENISFGIDNAEQDQIIEAAKKAQAHEFIMSFPDGYDTVIGQRGVTLSGGQRQRLAIARAFMTNPPILILDDSTSAIDSATEDKIQQAIWTAARGRTTILITHRLSQIRWADHIIVLRQGRVVAQGTHEELLETSESYRQIFARYD